jgi:hypothetical protein
MKTGGMGKIILLATSKLKHFVLVYHEHRSLLKYDAVWIAECYLGYDAVLL